MTKGLSNLIQRLNDNPTNPKKLKILLGDGYDPTDEIKHPRRILGREINDPSTITDSEHEKIWMLYEYVRLKTSNQYPDYLLYYLLRLAKQSIISKIVTTNYDCYWASIIEKRAFAFNVLINPLYPHPTDDGYYSKPSRPKNLDVYIIHGRLDFARFNLCNHRFPLFRFHKKWTLKDIIKKPKSKADYCGKCSLNNLYRHDIDWLNADNRTPYLPEIDVAKAKLFNDNTTSGILVLGFSGYYSKNPSESRKIEELVPNIEQTAKQGKIPIWIVNTRKQFEEMQKNGIDKYLIGILKKYKSVFIIDPIDTTMHYWFKNILHSAGVNIYSWELDYTNEWVNNQLFVDRKKFKRQ